MSGFSRTKLYERKEEKKQTHVEIKVLNDSRSSLSLKTTALTTPFLLTPLVVSADAFTDIHNFTINLNAVNPRMFIFISKSFPLQPVIGIIFV